MSDQIVQKIIDLLQTIGNSLATQAWTIAMKQVYVNLYTNIFLFILFGVLFGMMSAATVKSFNRHRKIYKEERHSNWNSEWDDLPVEWQILSMLTFVGDFIWLLMFSLSVSTILTYIINPQWVAIQIILNMVK